MSYDPSCEDLARHFLESRTVEADTAELASREYEQRVKELAQVIQNAIETEIEFQCW